MSKVKKYMLWYYMSGKRLLHKLSFVILLFLIPVITPITELAMQGESGIMHIALCNEGESEKVSAVINSLVEDDGIIRYTVFDDADMAKSAVVQFEADAAWIFDDEYEDKLDSYIKGESNQPIIQIVQREDSIQLKLAKEVLFGAIYNDVSYKIYRNFVYTDLVTQDVLSEDEVRNNYDSINKGNEIIKMETLNSDEERSQSNYLVVPLRGILSLLVVLCTLTASMYFLSDKQDGKFDWLPDKKRIVPAFASCLSAACFSALAVFISYFSSGIWTNFFNELISMFMFVIATTGFCLMFCLLIKSSGKLGALIPGIMIVMLVMSPIFFDFKELRYVQLLLPTNYYLNSIYNTEYYLYGTIYCIAIYFIVLVFNRIIKRHTLK